jgi:hypothetical protein
VKLGTNNMPLGATTLDNFHLHVINNSNMVAVRKCGKKTGATHCIILKIRKAVLFKKICNFYFNNFFRIFENNMTSLNTEAQKMTVNCHVEFISAHNDMWQ